jgi:two-component system sensor histidine kinase KdpD
VRRILASGGPCAVEELARECGPEGQQFLGGLRAVAAVPVVTDDVRGVLLAYAAQPDGAFSKPDVRFLATVGGHLAAGLEKARLHDKLAAHRDQLEETVAARTEQLREAYDSLREMERMKDRFLGNLSHEMRTPLTAILSAAHVVRDYKSSAKERRELVSSILSSAEILQQQLENLFRLVQMESGARPLRLSESTPEQLLQEAIQLAGHPGVQYKIAPLAGPVRYDVEGLPRALANLIDNAVKFSPPSSLVKVVVLADQLDFGESAIDAMAVSVLDRGPGVDATDRERVFLPFEQGGDPMTAKPRGIGVGLYEARTMAARHGGRLEYLPRKGGGSEFRLTVPLQPTAQQSPGETVEETLEVASV